MAKQNPSYFKQFMSGKASAIFKFLHQPTQATLLWQSLLVLIIFGIITTYILVHSEAIYSGYHLTDDHEMLRIAGDLRTSNHNIIETTVTWIKRDLSIRFRPFYFIHRILEIAIFGTNFTILSAYTALLSILSSFLFFIFGRKIGLNFVESVFFSCFILIGPQFCIWWRLGPNETIGMVMLSISLVFAAMPLHSKKFKTLYDIFLIFFLLLSSLSKESFILLIPAILLLKIYLSMDSCNKSFFEAIKQNAFPIVSLSIIFIVEMVIVLFFVGTSKLGNAGIDGNMSLKSLGKTAADFFSTGAIPIWVVISILFLVIVLILFIKEKKAFLKALLLKKKEIVFIFISAFLIIFPQWVLYTKSGIKDRYLLPGMMGVSFFIVYLMRCIRRTRVQWLYVIVLLLLSGAVLTNIRATHGDAATFAGMGEVNSRLFSFIDKNSDLDTPIIIASDPFFNYEDTISMQVYMRETLKRSNIYFYPIFSRKKYNAFGNSIIENYYRVFNQALVSKNQDIREFKLILLLSGNMQKKLLKELRRDFNFDKRYYRTKSIGRYFLLRYESNKMF